MVPCVRNKSTKPHYVDLTFVFSIGLFPQPQTFVTAQESLVTCSLFTVFLTVSRSCVAEDDQCKQIPKPLPFR